MGLLYPIVVARMAIQDRTKITLSVTAGAKGIIVLTYKTRKAEYSSNKLTTALLKLRKKLYLYQVPSYNLRKKYFLKVKNWP